MKTIKIGNDLIKLILEYIPTYTICYWCNNIVPKKQFSNKTKALNKCSECINKFKYLKEYKITLEIMKNTYKIINKINLNLLKLNNKIKLSTNRIIKIKLKYKKKRLLERKKNLCYEYKILKKYIIKQNILFNI